MDDPFVKDVDPSELEFAGEFLSSWLPFLTRDLCDQCSQTLTRRVRSLHPEPNPPDYDTAEPSLSVPAGPESESDPNPNPNPPDDDTQEPSFSGPAGPESDPDPNSLDDDTAKPSLSVPAGLDSDPDPNPNPQDHGTAEPSLPGPAGPESDSDPNPQDHGTAEPSLPGPAGPESDSDPNPPDHDMAEPSLSGPAEPESDPDPNPSDQDTAEPSLSGPAGPESDLDPAPISPRVRMSWADMAQEEDELAESAEEPEEPAKEGDEEEERKKKKKVELSREQREQIRFSNVGRKKDFICLERIRGKITNVLEGLELHTGIFSAAEQKRIVDFVYKLQEKGREGELGERTYSEPQKWMRGKGRVTIQFGCCYNYATDKNGNPPGILRNFASDPIPYLFKVIIRRLVSWHVLPPSCVPDSCIVNIYEPGDCIPPHIDSHDFVRPFSTVSFLSECNILFGSDLKIIGPGEFSGSTAIPLPVGSVLVLNGNGADVAKHCVPAVPTKRISITFRKMDEAKQPLGFRPEPDLQNLQPLQYDSVAREPEQQNVNKQPETDNKSYKKGKRPKRRSSGDNQHHQYEPQTPVIRPWQVIDARSATSSNRMTGRSRGYSTGRLFESKPRTDLQDVRLLRDDGWSSPQREFVNDEGSHSVSSNSMTGRSRGYSTGRSFESKPRTDLQDARLLRDDGWSSPQREFVNDKGSHSTSSNRMTGRSRGYSTGRSFESKPRTDLQDVRLPRDDGWSSPQREFVNDEGSHSTSSNSMMRRGRDSTGRATELKPRMDSQDVQLPQDSGRSSSQQDWISDEGGHLEVGKESGGRRVRLEQKRMIISCNVDREEEPMSAAHRTSYRHHHSEVPVQSRNNGRRRGRVVVSDD